MRSSEIDRDGKDESGNGPSPMKALILGIGNTIRGDDGVGIHIVRNLKKEMSFPGIDIQETHEAGLNLLGLLAGYDKIIMIDALRSGREKPGSIGRFCREDFRGKKGALSSHRLGWGALFDWMEPDEIGKSREIVIYGVEIEENEYFSEEVTAPVRKAIPRVTEQIQKEVSRWRFKC